MSKNPITPNFIQFFKDLAANNNRDWFHANKKDYESYVKKPFYELTQSLIDTCGFDLEVKNAVFRINRDVRFSKDKSPYKNFVASVISPYGRKNMEYPGLYLHMEPGNFMIGGGCYQPSKENLTKIRSYIVKHPERAYEILGDDAFVSTFGELQGDKNKILPKEFKSYGAEIPLLFNKGYFFMATYEDESKLIQEDLVSFIMDHVNIGSAWTEYLIEALA